MKNNSQRVARQVSRGKAKRNAQSRKPSLRVIGCDSVPTFSRQALSGLKDISVLDPDFTEPVPTDTETSDSWANYIEE